VKRLIIEYWREIIHEYQRGKKYDLKSQNRLIDHVDRIEIIYDVTLNKEKEYINLIIFSNKSRYMFHLYKG
jgi:hypothetical protein